MISNELIQAVENLEQENVELKTKLTTKDKALQLALDTLEKMSKEKDKCIHGYTDEYACLVQHKCFVKQADEALADIKQIQEDK
jgi:hypothetical protein